MTNLLGPPMTRREYEPVAKYARKLIEAYEQHRVPKRPMSIDDFLLQEAYYLYHGVKWVRLGFPTREVTRCSGRLSDAVHQDGIDASWNDCWGCSEKVLCEIRYACTACVGRKRVSGRSECGQYANFVSGEAYMIPERLRSPLKVHRSYNILTSYMGDLMDPNIDYGYLDLKVTVIWWSNQHEYVWLTSHPSRMRTFFNDISRWRGSFDDFANLIIGVSVRDQWGVNYRLPDLLKTQVRRRQILLHPLTGPVDLRPYLDPTKIELVTVEHSRGNNPRIPKTLNEWCESVREQCRAAGVAVHIRSASKWAELGAPMMLRDLKVNVNLSGLYNGNNLVVYPVVNMPIRPVDKLIEGKGNIGVLLGSVLRIVSTRQLCRENSHLFLQLKSEDRQLQGEVS